MQEIKPTDIQLGNFIAVCGNPEVVMGITPRPDGSFFVHHSASRQERNPFGEGIEFNGYPIPLDEAWKKFLNVEKYTFPEWIRYVHEAQNYVRWYAGHDLLPYVNWSILPDVQELFGHDSPQSNA